MILLLAGAGFVSMTHKSRFNPDRLWIGVSRMKYDANRIAFCCDNEIHRLEVAQESLRKSQKRLAASMERLEACMQRLPQ